MRILFVTTPPNDVLDFLQGVPGVTVLSVAQGEGKTGFLARVEFLLRHSDFDILLTYRCPYLLPGRLWRRVKRGAFNLHPSLLPKYPGLNPWEAILSSGDAVNGVSLHRMNDQADAGEVILQASYPLDTDETLESARDKADRLSARVIQEWLSCGIAP